MRTTWAVLAAVFALLAGACSDSDDSSDQSGNGDGTDTSSEEAVDYTQPGQYAAGITTLTIPGPDGSEREVDVSYPVDPAAVEGEATETFDVLQLVPDEFRDFVPEELSGEIDTGAVRDAPSADGRFPVVIYSHGFGGYRQVYTDLTTHLASQGFVVASADHVERGLINQALGQTGGEPDQDVTDVRNTITALADADRDSASVLNGAVDTSAVGITGHSAGAGTSARSAAEIEEISAYSSIAGGAPVEVEAGDTGVRFARLSADAPDRVVVEIADVTPDSVTVTVDGGSAETIAGDPAEGVEIGLEQGTVTLFVGSDGELMSGTVEVERVSIAKPLLVIFGENDETVAAERSIDLYESQPPPKWLVGIAGAGHNSFTDSCRLIIDQGGLQALVDLLGEAQVARAEDGCLAGDTEPEVAQAATRQATTAFFIGELLGEDSSASLTEEAIVEFSGATLSDYASS